MNKGKEEDVDGMDDQILGSANAIISSGHGGELSRRVTQPRGEPGFLDTRIHCVTLAFERIVYRDYSQQCLGWRRHHRQSNPLRRKLDPLSINHISFLGPSCLFSH